MSDATDQQVKKDTDVWDNITGSLMNFTNAMTTLGSTVDTVKIDKILPKKKQLKQTKKGFMDIASSMKLGVSSSLGWVGLLVAALEALGFLEPIVNTIMSLVQVLSIGLSPILIAVINIIMSLIPVFDTLNQIIAPIAVVLANLISSVLLPIAPLLNAMLEPFIPMIVLLAQIASLFINLNQSLSLMPIILAILIPWFNFVAQAFTTILTPISNFVAGLQTIPAAISGFFTNLAAVIQNFFTNLFSNIGNWLSQAINDIIAFFKRIPSLILSAIENAFEAGIGNFGSNILNTIGGWFS